MSFSACELFSLRILELASLFYILKYDKLWGLPRRVITLFIAPQASAEGACILEEVGFYGACMMSNYGAY